MFFLVVIHCHMSGAEGLALALAPLQNVCEGSEQTGLACFPADVLISPPPVLIVFEAIPQDPAWIDSARLCTHSTLYQPCDLFKNSAHTSDIRACKSEEGAFLSSSPPQTFKVPSSAAPPNLRICVYMEGGTPPAERRLTFCMLNHSVECAL